MSRVAQLVGAALLLGTGLLAVFAGSAAAEPAAGTEVPGSDLPIGSFTANTPFSSGQVIEVKIPANSTFASGAGIKIAECAAPNNVIPTDPAQCDGLTVQADTVLAGSDGSVDYTTTNTTAGYTVYSLPNSALGESPSSRPVCDLSDECVLYVGEDQNDFTQPHFWSQPFFVTPTPGSTGANPGDGSAPPAPTGADAGKSTVTAAAVPPSPVADGVDPATVTVRLLDSNSVPVPGKTVTLTGASGSSVITPASVVSASDGTAVFTVTDATPESVTYSASDTTDSVDITQTASVTFAAPVVTPSHSSVSASPSQVAADGVTASTITVTLRDQGANPAPVAGKVVAVTASGGSSVVTAVSATTDSSGSATFTVVDASTESVTYSATDTTDSVPLTSTASVTFGTLAVSATSSTVVAASSVVEVGSAGTQGTPVTVTLLSSGGSPVSAKTVSLTGSPATTVIVSPTSVVTDQNGKATFTISDSTAESVVFTATDVTDSLALTQTATVMFATPVPSPSMSTISASPSTVPADGSSSSTVVVTIEDQFGNALAGKAVTLHLTDASGNAEAPPVVGAATPGTTDASGKVEYTLKDTSAETVTIGAVDSTDSVTLTATASVTFTAGAADGSMSTISANPTSVPSDGTTASTVTVTIYDHFKSPLSGKSVTIQASGGKSVITPASAVTGQNGVATFLVTDSTAEIVTYTATDTTDAVPLSGQGVAVTFGTPPAPPPAVADSVLSASAASAPADGSSVVTVTAQLYDANGAAVPGKTVALNLQGTGHSVVKTVAGVSDQNGQATFTVTDTTVETVTYTATDTTDDLPITGQSVTISFTTPGVASTTTTTSGAGTTTTVAGSAGQSGIGGAQASTAASSGAVGASSGQLALTGTPSLLPWLVGLGLFLLVSGSLGRRLLGTES